MGFIKDLSRREAREYSMRGHKKAKASAKFAYCIEGKYYSAADIAKELGVHQTTAHHKLKKAQVMDGPVTWQRLREISG